MAEGLSKLEAVRLALAELGEATAVEVSAFVRRRFGLKVPAAFVPVVRASLLEKEALARSAEASARAAREAEGEPT
jgi:hypothetical protein